MRTMRVAVAAAALIATAGCPKQEGSDTGTPGTDAAEATDAMEPPPDAGPGTDATVNACPGGMMAIDVTADVTADTTWSACNVYTLTTHVFVEGGATLTIEAGTLVLGDMGSSLVVTSSGSIDAQGTAAAPIAFTSSMPAGSRASGDWGGVVLLGLASINVAGGVELIEGFPAGEMRVEYGGTDDAHDCGTLRYVRIEFAGFELMPGNELNGLSVGGCGTGTELDFIQVHQGADDGVEFFGGTAGVKHLVISEPNDDGLDWDFGWTGNVQFLIVEQNAVEGENGIEADNHPTSFDSLPRSHPVIWNATLIGSDAAAGGAVTQRGAVLRRGTAAELNNLIMAHFADEPIDVRDAATAALTPADLFARNSIFFDNGNMAVWNDATDDDGGFDEGAYFTGEATNLVDVDPMLADALALGAPDFTPLAGSPALVAANAGTPPSAGGFFDTTATYIGAVGTVDWTAGWTSYPAN